MIKVSKNIAEIPKSLKGRNSLAAAERKQVSTFYANRANHKKKFTYSVYQRKDVKKWLVDLFKGKCAYCESKIRHIYPGDIEHFRPKSELHIINKGSKKNTVIKPGYYWLAADWNNLLLSCKDCNSKREQQLEDGSYLKVGKANFFPILDEKKRVRTFRQRFQNEESVRLLINPCIENPETYFSYDLKDGRILPKSKEKMKKLMADTSKDIYALHRMDLVHRRKALIAELFNQIRRIENASTYYGRAKKVGDKKHFQDEFKKEMDVLLRKCQADSEYAGLARYMYNDIVKDLIAKGKILALKTKSGKNW